jgi:citrate synthase
MLTRRRQGGTRESRFDPAEIARLAERRRSGSSRSGALEVVIDSALTLLDPIGHLWYRGWDVELGCRSASFEQVAEWLWTAAAAAAPLATAAAAAAAAAASPAAAPLATAAAAAAAAAAPSTAAAGAPPAAAAAAAPFAAPPAVLAAARRAASWLPPATPPIDRVRVALAAAATADPLRFDRRPDAVAAAGRRIIAVLVDALPVATPGAAVAGDTIAERLWSRLCPTSGRPSQIAVLDAALILLADHEMASSTLAARVAASTWADPYLVVTAGLAALGGPLHGSVGDRLVPMLHDAVHRGAAEAMAARWRVGEKVWGFGHFVYTNRDPRAEALWPLLQAAWPGNEVVAVTGDVIAAVTAHGATFPNVDLMLAALVGAAGMVDGSAEVVFAAARTVGWLAHAIEEYEHFLRFRLRAAYTGPAPGTGMRPAARSR